MRQKKILACALSISLYLLSCERGYEEIALTFLRAPEKNYKLLNKLSRSVISEKEWKDISPATFIASSCQVIDGFPKVHASPLYSSPGESEVARKIERESGTNLLLQCSEKNGNEKEKSKYLTCSDTSTSRFIELSTSDGKGGREDEWKIPLSTVRTFQLRQLLNLGKEEMARIFAEEMKSQIVPECDENENAKKYKEIFSVKNYGKNRRIIDVDEKIIIGGLLDDIRSGRLKPCDQLPPLSPMLELYIAIAQNMTCSDFTYRGAFQPPTRNICGKMYRYSIADWQYLEIMMKIGTLEQKSDLLVYLCNACTAEKGNGSPEQKMICDMAQNRELINYRLDEAGKKLKESLLKH